MECGNLLVADPDDFFRLRASPSPSPPAGGAKKRQKLVSLFSDDEAAAEQAEGEPPVDFLVRSHRAPRRDAAPSEAPSDGPGRGRGDAPAALALGSARWRSRERPRSPGRPYNPPLRVAAVASPANSFYELEEGEIVEESPPSACFSGVVDAVPPPPDKVRSSAPHAAPPGTSAAAPRDGIETARNRVGERPAPERSLDSFLNNFLPADSKLDALVMENQIAELKEQLLELRKQHRQLEGRLAVAATGGEQWKTRAIEAVKASEVAAQILEGAERKATEKAPAAERNSGKELSQSADKAAAAERRNPGSGAPKAGDKASAAKRRNSGSGASQAPDEAAAAERGNSGDGAHQRRSSMSSHLPLSSDNAQELVEKWKKLCEEANKELRRQAKAHSAERAKQDHELNAVRKELEKAKAALPLAFGTMVDEKNQLVQDLAVHRQLQKRSEARIKFLEAQLRNRATRPPSAPAPTEAGSSSTAERPLAARPPPGAGSDAESGRNSSAAKRRTSSASESRLSTFSQPSPSQRGLPSSGTVSLFVCRWEECAM
ncbi:MAG: hypothetical protein BJ554DRAFT_5332, partial [Olpidium bornovanus]